MTPTRSECAKAGVCAVGALCAGTPTHRLRPASPTAAAPFGLDCRHRPCTRCAADLAALAAFTDSDIQPVCTLCRRFFTCGRCLSRVSYVTPLNTDTHCGHGLCLGCMTDTSPCQLCTTHPREIGLLARVSALAAIPLLEIPGATLAAVVSTTGELVGTTLGLAGGLAGAATTLVIGSEEQAANNKARTVTLPTHSWTELRALGPRAAWRAGVSVLLACDRAVTAGVPAAVTIHSVMGIRTQNEPPDWDDEEAAPTHKDTGDLGWTADRVLALPTEPACVFLSQLMSVAYPAQHVYPSTAVTCLSTHGLTLREVLYVMHTPVDTLSRWSPDNLLRWTSADTVNVPGIAPITLTDLLGYAVNEAGLIDGVVDAVYNDEDQAYRDTLVHAAAAGLFWQGLGANVHAVMELDPLARLSPTGPVFTTAAFEAAVARNGQTSLFVARLGSLTRQVTSRQACKEGTAVSVRHV
jgi:hypothetical protein